MPERKSKEHAKTRVSPFRRRIGPPLRVFRRPAARAKETASHFFNMHVAKRHHNSHRWRRPRKGPALPRVMAPPRPFHRSAGRQSSQITLSCDEKPGDHTRRSLSLPSLYADSDSQPFDGRSPRSPLRHNRDECCQKIIVPSRCSYFDRTEGNCQAPAIAGSRNGHP